MHGHSHRESHVYAYVGTHLHAHLHACAVFTCPYRCPYACMRTIFMPEHMSVHMPVHTSVPISIHMPPNMPACYPDVMALPPASSLPLSGAVCTFPHTARTPARPWCKPPSCASGCLSSRADFWTGVVLVAQKRHWSKWGMCFFGGPALARHR